VPEQQPGARCRHERLQVLDLMPETELSVAPPAAPASSPVGHDDQKLAGEGGGERRQVLHGLHPAMHEDQPRVFAVLPRPNCGAVRRAVTLLTYPASRKDRCGECAFQAALRSAWYFHPFADQGC
jgi:hypothetical protein